MNIEKLAGQILSEIPQLVDENEKIAVKKDIVGCLESSFQLEFPPSFDSTRYVTETDSGDLPLRSWLSKSVAAGDYSDVALKPLFSLAELLGFLSQRDPALLFFHPDWFFVATEERISFDWLRLRKGLKPIGASRPDEFQRAFFRNLMHPELSVSFKDVQSGRSVGFGFFVFLASVLLDIKISEKLSFLEKIEKKRVRAGSMNPEIPEYFVKIIEESSKDPSQFSIRDNLEKIIVMFRENPLKLNSLPSTDILHDIFANSVMGNKKKSRSNEDEVLCESLAPNISFLMVTDGVSTANLGSGKLAAEEIRRTYDLLFKSQFEELAKKLVTPGSGSDHSSWSSAAEQLMLNFARESHTRVVNLINAELIRNKPDAPEKIVHTMSATLVCSMIFGDQAVMLHIGDSPAWLYSPSRKRFFRISTDDTVEQESGYSHQEREDAEALTRVIGMCDFDQEKMTFVPADINMKKYEVQLAPGDLLFLASDGLHKCIDQPTDPLREAALRARVEKSCSGAGDMDQICVSLIKLANDEGLGSDNITVSACRTRKKEKQRG
ncbi:MAG: SpoIIE family protein phosphatase [Candidatus Riflebacteria bacterium]|nr:SpoIIE family protein phosphatase [Candidatus Riflebacteria bacterium]